MKLTTRVFGEIEIEDSKIIHFPGGIIGFPEMTEFALLYDEEKGKDTPIRWLQSLQEAQFALPVMNPLLVSPDYNPQVEDELMKPLGEFAGEDIFVLVTVTVPREISLMSVNLQAPLVVNAATRKAVQMIVNPEEYPIKFYIYNLLQKKKREGE